MICRSYTVTGSLLLVFLCVQVEWDEVKKSTKNAGFYPLFPFFFLSMTERGHCGHKKIIIETIFVRLNFVPHVLLEEFQINMQKPPLLGII